MNNNKEIVDKIQYIIGILDVSKESVSKIFGVSKRTLEGWYMGRTPSKQSVMIINLIYNIFKKSENKL